MRTALSWAISRRGVVIPYRCFGATCPSHLQWSRFLTLEDSTVLFRFSVFSSIIVITNRRMSFVVKYGWKGILSVFEVLKDYLITFGVGIVGGSSLLRRLRIVLGSRM
jgi:hypothetical protein